MLSDPPLSRTPSTLGRRFPSSPVLQTWLPYLRLKICVHVMRGIRACPMHLLVNNTIHVGKLTTTLRLFGKAPGEPSLIAYIQVRAEI